MTCFFQIIFNRNMFLNRGCVLKIQGVFKMTVTPPLVALCLTQMSMAMRVTASNWNHILGKQLVHFGTTKSEEETLKGGEATQCVCFTVPVKYHSLVVLIRNPNHGICQGRFYLLRWLVSVACFMWISKHLFDILVISQHYE